ncbi:Rieske 2Fe-2S domain-containing protein [Streptomyces sp. NPDC006332]|uniref:caspase, EACC1-associated type n=1 Tax=Streptomyces sp. NPDC006332 TaxID=3155456 RepID=UPI0033B84F25
MRLPDPTRSNAVLIGTGTFRSSDLRDVPAVRGNLTDLAAVLSDPVFGSFPAGRCAVVPDPADARTACRALRDAADAAEDTLLVYFAGHGLLGARGELFLAMADTDPAELRVSALEYDVLREVVSECGADNRVVVLDCCFSGRAVPALGTVLSQTAIEGTYVLASAPPNGLALAPDGAAHTAFTGELIRLLRDGVPGGPELLGLGEIYRRLLRAAVLRGLPRPECSGTGTSDLLALAGNAALGPTSPEVRRASEVPASPGEPEAVGSAKPGASKTLVDVPPPGTPSTTSPSPTLTGLSRRRTLASMASVAVAGGGIGIGLTAWKVLDRVGSGDGDHAGGRASGGPSSVGESSATTRVTASPSATTRVTASPSATATANTDTNTNTKAKNGDDSHAAGGPSAGPSTPDAGVPSKSAPTTQEDAFAWRAIAETADVPVGGGLVVAQEKVVVTQPLRGVFHAFTALCTHQGCTVSTISEGAIRCPCHGSAFDITDGSVRNGPATKALSVRRVQVRGGSVEITADA